MSSYLKKPFPWCCSNCGEQAVYEATVDYTTQMSHDGLDYTIKMDGMKIPQCKNCGTVHPDIEALGLLDAALCRAANLLTPEQIRDSRTEANLSQQELASALGVHVSEVERLEDGGQIQTRVLDHLLRLFFGVAQVRKILTTHQIGTLVSSPV